MGHHRERDVPVPTVPEAHFILIQSGLAFGLLNALLDRVALACDKRELARELLAGAYAR